MIAAAIASYMKENGIKQSFLCEKTGLTKHCVCAALNSKRKLTIDEYELICSALNVPYDFFFERSRESA